MFRLAVAFLFLTLPGLPAQEDDAPPVAITSPDTAVTYAFGTIKNHALVWNKQAKILFAEVTFTDDRQDNDDLPTEDDTHWFRLPGVTLDAATGLFYAPTGKGELVPIARFKKAFFFTTIQVLPNAAVRVMHSHGNVSVVLEAVLPSAVAKDANVDRPEVVP